MMEEVSDDPNGESTFEFVGGKSDEKLIKETDGASNVEASTEQLLHRVEQLSTTETQNFPVSTMPASTTPYTSSEASVQFYDPTQYGASQPFFTPFSPQQQTAATPSTQSQYATPPQSESSQAAPPPPPVFQPAIPSQHSIPEVGVAMPLSGVDALPMAMHEGAGEGGVWGWIKGTQFLNKVAEKAKNSVDSVITTLDPGMKEIINSGGDISVIVASGNEGKISAVREAFQLVFGKATVQGIATQPCSIAPQPVGFSAGLKAAEERIGNLRQQGFIQSNHVLVAVENFVTELTPENWFDIGCLLLQDNASGISLQVYTEAVPVSSHYIFQAKDQTPADFPLGWSGYAVTIGQIIGSSLGVHQSQWHEALSGVSRREILFLAAKTLAGLYKGQLRR